MLDFLFAMIATGVAAPTDGQRAQAATVQSPSVVVGSNVQIGSGVAVGGTQTAQTPTATGGGLSLLEGTTEASQTAAPEVAQSAPAAQAVSGFNMSVVPAGLVAEPQDATGKFTTATEIRPIMDATRGNWVAVREYNGQDLLYVTHIWGWRCGLHAMAISVNGETMQNWPLPPCHTQYATPNAVLEEDGLPYLTLKQGAVQTIEIQLVYDDLSMDSAQFERGNVLIP